VVCEKGLISEGTKGLLRHKRGTGCLAEEVPCGYRLKENGEILEPIP